MEGITAEDLVAIVRALTPHLPEVERVSRLFARAEDVIVIEAAGPLTPGVRDRIHAYAKQVWPEHRVLVLDDSLRVKVVEAKHGDGLLLSDYDPPPRPHDVSRSTYWAGVLWNAVSPAVRQALADKHGITWQQLTLAMREDAKEHHS